MKMRKQIRLPDDPKELTTRHMEYIEKIRAFEVEEAKAKLNVKAAKAMSSDDKRIAWLGFFAAIAACTLFLSFPLYYMNKDRTHAKSTIEKNKDDARVKEAELRRDTKAMELGYELRMVPGNPDPVWTKVGP